jgi:phosphate transport system substrate-binding protein
LTVWIGRFGPTHPDIRIDAAATGSGVGIASATSGSAQIGASDAYLNDAQMKPKDLLNIPLAVSAQEIDYNVPELRGAPPLHLSGSVLAGIYAGTIPRWDDPVIAALNPGLTLPHHVIVPVRRTDGSGDTFLFTKYLSLSTATWDQTVHYGTNVHWPKNANATEGTGNAGMIVTCSDAPYSIAYVGISYADRAQSAGLEVAAVQNRTGRFVLPTTAATQATAAAMQSTVPDDGRLSMIYTPGASAYPLVNFEYAIVKSEQSAPGSAAALRDFLNWVVSQNQGNDAALLGAVHFAPLPERVRVIAKREISAITGP